MTPGYSISLPQGERGVYTVSLFADDPRHDATLHIDQYSGAVLAEVRWQDYLCRGQGCGIWRHAAYGQDVWPTPSVGDAGAMSAEPAVIPERLVVVVATPSGPALWRPSFASLATTVARRLGDQ